MSQLGSGVLRKPAPKFANVVVVADTWKEKDNTQMQRTDDGDGEVYNYTFWNPGVDAQCDVVVKLGEDLLIVGSVLTGTGTDTRAFTVVGVDTSDFGGKPLKQSLQLAYHEGFTPTVVDETP